MTTEFLRNSELPRKFTGLEKQMFLRPRVKQEVLSDKLQSTPGKAKAEVSVSRRMVPTAYVSQPCHGQACALWKEQQECLQRAPGSPAKVTTSGHCPPLHLEKDVEVSVAITLVGRDSYQGGRQKLHPGLQNL